MYLNSNKKVWGGGVSETGGANETLSLNSRYIGNNGNKAVGTLDRVDFR